MPSIFLFPGGDAPLSLNDVLSTMAEVVDHAIELEHDDADEDSGEFSMATIAITDADGERGTAKIAVIPREERGEAITELVDSIIAEDAAMAGPLRNNAHDVVVDFGDEGPDCFAGLITAYSIAAVAECGLLVTGLGAHDDECEHGEDEECDASVWFDTPDDFADAFFGEDDEDGDADDEDDDEDEGPGAR